MIKVSVSVKPNSDVIISQEFIAEIKLTSNIPIDNSISISLENTSYISPVGKISSFTPSYNNTSGSFFVRLLVSDKITSGELVSFDIKSSYFGTKHVEYVAKHIQQETLSLKFYKKYLPTPDQPNFPSQGEICSKVMTTIKSSDGQPLSGTPIFIPYLYNFKDFDIYDSEKNKIEVTSAPMKGFFINSNEKGEVIFYVYPHIGVATKITLDSMIYNATSSIHSMNELYVASSQPQGNDSLLDPPDIENIHGENLTSPNSFIFKTKVDQYDNAKSQDTILFFVNNIFTGYAFTIESIDDLGGYSIKLPYKIFEKYKDVACSFYYIIFSVNENVYYSYPLSIVFKGGVPNTPQPDINRIYNTCVVYNSAGISPDNILQEMDYVDSTEISNYRNNPDNAGLFVQIMGTNDLKDNSNVPLGSEVFLNLYINSSTKTVHHSLKKTMQNLPDGNNNSAKLIFNIPHSCLIDCLAYPDRGGDIYFDYQIGFDNDDDLTYGKVWQGRIDTPIID
ncbi:hypothetical protein XBJ2_60065 [Xenorhabdus bovienii str. Jollieti]|uniref:Uncharacterized protein n=1 Tax=Xenorhabdus bovienii (strain SS-2004) TaxID=406818 RepID=D3UYI8_XENBS|nr:hypothetical protein [Xenorhabdus bovienii]CBJ79366.1 hypothetical protein XBJ1_0215 [Xenorhabdus bovienii SS-2004]CDH30209.1 hypothetical protein XBJ2_60065 [Xenorhabdus bovienii str. Jollieti]